MSDMMKLHQEFFEGHPHFLAESFNSSWILRCLADRFIDMETGKVDLGEDFIELITYADSITSPGFVARYFASFMNPLTEQSKAERYMFQIDVMGLLHHHYFLDFDGIHPFAGMVPLVNDRGEMLVESTHSFDNYLLNANATTTQKAIAWDFIMFMMQADNLPTEPGYLGLYLACAPNRGLFEHIIREHLPIYFGQNRWNQHVYPWFPGTVDEAIDGLIARRTLYGDLPMQSMSRFPRVIDDIIEENMGKYHDGLFSIEQTALNLQNQITLALMEMYR